MKKIITTTVKIVITFFSISSIGKTLEFNVPENPPGTCLLVTQDGNSCSAFRSQDAFFYTAAHCLYKLDLKQMVLELREFEEFKLLCPFERSESDNKSELNYYNHIEIPLRHLYVNTLWTIGEKPSLDDMAIVISKSDLQETTVIKQAQSSEEIQLLLKHNNCFTSGYSRGHYAEFKADSKSDSFDIVSGLLNLNVKSNTGDSGGPVICHDSNGAPVVIGMTTHRDGDLSILNIQNWKKNISHKNGFKISPKQ